MLAQVGDVGVLEVGHEHLRARVQRVDDHLAVDRAGDLDAAVQQVGGDRRDLQSPSRIVRGLGQEVGQLAGVEALLALGPRREQLLARAVEVALQVGQEGQRLGSQDFILAKAVAGCNGDPVLFGCCERHLLLPIFTCGTVYVAPHPHSPYEPVRSLSKAT